MKNLILTVLSLAVLALGVSALTGGEYVVEAIVGSLVVGGLLSIAIPSGSLASAIPVIQAQSVLTKKVVAVYKEKIPVKGFLRSFFMDVESMTRQVSIAVKRGREKVAVDVQRHSDGTRNMFSYSTEKIFEPPFYDEYLNANDHRLYDVVITALNDNNVTFFAQMTQELAEDVMELQKKIERAIELQCAQVLQSGIIQLNAGINIDFKRKPESLVALTPGNTWNVGTVSPYRTLEDGCKFLRTEGKAQGGVFNAILGEEAIRALLENQKFLERNDNRRLDLDGVREPQRNSEGAASHGEITCGDYIVRLWTYPEYYENANGDMVPYIEPKNVVLIPDNPEFVMNYAAVPQLIEDNGSIPQRGAFLVQDFIDRKKISHEIHVKSAPIAVPVAVNQIYTVQVLS